MKKILISIVFMFGALTFTNAQTAPATPQASKAVSKKQDKAAKDAAKDTKEAQKKADKDAEAMKKKQEVDDAKNKAKSTGINKNGTPDMRLKANKAVKAANAPVTNAQPAPPPSAPVTRTRTNAPVAKAQPAPVAPSNANTTDKVLETDAKGRTIYEGKRGGRYYINKNGKKEYIKH